MLLYVKFDFYTSDAHFAYLLETYIYIYINNYVFDFVVLGFKAGLCSSSYVLFKVLFCFIP